MSLFAFYGLVVFISLSGVMAPGPLSAIALTRGRHNPLAGFWINLGHAIAEVPLMFILLAGFTPLLQSEGIIRVLSALGGAVLLWMGAGLLRQPGGEGADAPTPPSRENSVAAGIAMTALNPYWFLWWLTVGVSILIQARALGSGLVIALTIALHLACDLAWGTFLSWAAHRGGRLFRGGGWRWVERICGGALILFAGIFFYKAASGI
ncbi:MAG: LysE family transporter [bacterium]|nr:LysE family transporter [bacterium]